MYGYVYIHNINIYIYLLLCITVGLYILYSINYDYLCKISIKMNVATDGGIYIMYLMFFPFNRFPSLMHFCYLKLIFGNSLDTNQHTIKIFFTVIC